MGRMLEAKQIIRDRYQLREKLGNNTGRQTWLAQDLQSETTELVVVKLLAVGGNIQWTDVKLFEREAQTLQQLKHPRIPKYKDYFSLDESDLWFGLVQEHIPGNSLKEVLDGGKRFGEVEVVNIAQEILQILVYLHSFNPPLLHRDIKPSNLILGDDSKIYLVDFGAVQDSFTTEGSTFTVVGTYGYAPLEQFGGKAVPASDLYALGATLIHLLTRTSPGELPNKDLKLQFRDRVTVSSKFANWLDKMIVPAVERRFSSATQALKYLPIPESIDPNYPDLVTENTSSQSNITKPLYTKVKLERRPEKLEITIPIQGINKINYFLSNFNDFIPTHILGGGLILLVLMFPHLSLIIIILAFFNDPQFKYLFLTTKIKINREQFFIIHSFLGFKNIDRGVTPTIKDVSINYIPSTKKLKNLKTDSIIINTKKTFGIDAYDKHLFGYKLTEPELIWLVQEIRDWLNSVNIEH